MAPRGRPRKAGNMRIDAAIAKVSCLGYETPLIRRTVNKLLKVYDGEWVFIEDDNYKVVVETLLDDQEEELKLLTYNEEDKDSSSDGAGPSNTRDDAGISDAYDVREDIVWAYLFCSSGGIILKEKSDVFSNEEKIVHHLVGFVSRVKTSHNPLGNDYRENVLMNPATTGNGRHQNVLAKASPMLEKN
ncbi:hypothetical protein IFM89_036355 [Coptis chinensis]|uniref:WIYLD domain-containing protein n=1 Tax=Coptis chinensis TaxID=261450 RepID=A0A835LPV8_9MAGN|nr:hypothetical protein IFM89_036355 [Coptis chinensis]